MSNNSLLEKSRREELVRVAEQAAQWLVILEDEPDIEHGELADWLLESPLHTEMFLRAAAIDRMGASLHSEALKGLMKRLDEESGNVLPLHEVAAKAAESHFLPSVPKKVNVGIKNPVPLWLSTIAALLAIGAVWWITSRNDWQSYATVVGEQRSIALPDASIMYVNTRSHVDVRYSLHARDVRLLSGEALFTVQSDGSRPFRVYVNDDIVIQTIGTQFNVYRRSDSTTVSVVEGRLQISRGAPRSLNALVPFGGKDLDHLPAPVLLAAGEEANIESDGRISKRNGFNVSQVLAWRQRKLDLRNATFAEVAEQFNRYNNQIQIRVEGSAVRAKRLNVVLNADEPESFITLLRRDSELSVERHGNQVIVRERQL